MIILKLYNYFYRLHAKKKWRKAFANIEQELMSRSDWPVITCDVDLGTLESSDKRRNSCKLNICSLFSCGLYDVFF